MSNRKVKILILQNKKNYNDKLTTEFRGKFDFLAKKRIFQINGTIDRKERKKL